MTLQAQQTEMALPGIKKDETASTEKAVLRDVSRSPRSTNEVKPEKVLKSRGSKLTIGRIVLTISGGIDVGREGHVYLIPKLTVAQADALLDRVPKGQRGRRPDHVRALGNDHKAGRFNWVGDCIRVDGNGRLIDGQHRLAAIVKTGVPMLNVMLAVVLKKGSIACIDEGARRNIIDRRMILGKPAYGYSTIASIVYEVSKPDWTRHTRRGQSIAEIDTIIDACRYADEAQQIYVEALRTYGNLDSALGAVAIRCMRKNRKQGRDFFLAVARNEHTINGGKTIKPLQQACNVMLNLAKRGDAHETGDQTKRRVQATHQLIEAWNAYRGGERLPSPWRYRKGETIPEAI